jgi:hypothetical protein
MKYIVKVEISVYEADGEMDDVTRSSISVRGDKDAALAAAYKFQDAARDIMRASTKQPMPDAMPDKPKPS